MSFPNFKACNKLFQLAKNPPKLTDPNFLTPQRLKSCVAESCGFKLLYGTEKITDEVLNALIDLAKEANLIDKMKGMQNGEKVNYTDGDHTPARPALHTAVRDFFDRPNTNPVARDAAALAKKEAERMREFFQKIEKEKTFDEMIMVAIGGSDLGPRAHYLALEYLRKPNKKVHFISNVDPDDSAHVLRQVKDFSKTLVVVVSKSGTTLETATNEALVRNEFKKRGLNPNSHFISVTMPNTPMDNPKLYLNTFHIWEWVGGRFSTSSACGGVVLSFAYGFDIYWQMLEGAHAMDQAALNSDYRSNLPLLSALIGIWNRNFLGYPTLAFIPYSQALYRYAAHIQQVEMESNGKLVDQRGTFIDFQTVPVVWGEPGTNAQHSFFQMLHQGTAIVPMSMIGFKESQYNDDLIVEGTTSQEKLLANLFAQSLALATGQGSEDPNKVFPGNRPSHIILGEKLTPFNLGSLLALFEHRVAFQGFLWGINSYDQEGVQLGKVLAGKIDQHFAAIRDHKKESNPYPIGDAYLEHLKSFKPHGKVEKDLALTR